MRWLRLTDIVDVLLYHYHYGEVRVSHTAVLACMSPRTGMTVPFPMGQGDYLPENLVHHMLFDEGIDFGRIDNTSR